MMANRRAGTAGAFVFGAIGVNRQRMIGNRKAFAYVRPHDIDVQPYTAQAALVEGKGEGIIAKLDRAIVIGPIARLELIPKDDSRPAGGPLVETLIEAQLPAQQFRELGLREGDTVVLTPRRARVFVDAGDGI